MIICKMFMHRLFVFYERFFRDMDTRLNSRNTCSLTNENKSMPEILWEKLKERESLKLNHFL